MSKKFPAAILGVLSLVGVIQAADAHSEEKPPLPKGPRIDVVFAIDTTGSMGDEIDVVKQRLQGMVAEIASGQPRPDVRFGMVAYRDRGDAYVTRPVELSRDVKSFHQHIQALEADGGGDEPEDVIAGLSYAIDRMNWDSSPEVSRMVFLIGDAGPHQYQDEPSIKVLTSRAKEKRIKVTAIGCSGLRPDGENAFRTVATGTGGAFDYLTYQRVAVLEGGKKGTVLTRAGSTFVSEGTLSDSEWKKGADALAKRGMAAPAAPSAGIAPVVSGANNLDALITGSIKSEAARNGVKY